MTALHFAAENGLTDVCKLIIENIDYKNPAAYNGCTPLHLAAMEGNLEIVRLFVETGVDKNCLFYGRTPLDLAGPLRPYSFYKLLSKDKTQLCGKILINLLCCFAFNFFSFFFLFFILWPLFLVSFINGFLCIIGKLALGSFVAAFVLTFIISLKIGFPRKTPNFY